ncbi:unnamed protein product [Blepharisma stoltei]|uniref:GRIP domain-containing protein n=1 Tax=Blepharisma stoltei TaxID=1481888 RepID=A0AAU9JHQ4_9CILI|nr:unnamed protein product [Blepharisma stoltei]
MSSRSSTRERERPRNSPYQHYKQDIYKPPSMESILASLSTKVKSLEDKYMDFVNYCARLLMENKAIIEKRLENDITTNSTNYYSEHSTDKEKIDKDLEFVMSVKNSYSSPRNFDTFDRFSHYIKEAEEEILNLCVNDIFDMDSNEIKRNVLQIFNILSRQISEIVTISGSSQELNEKILVLTTEKNKLEEILEEKRSSDLQIMREKMSKLEELEKELAKKELDLNNEIGENRKKYENERQEIINSYCKKIKQLEQDIQNFKEERQSLTLALNEAEERQKMIEPMLKKYEELKISSKKLAAAAENYEKLYESVKGWAENEFSNANMGFDEKFREYNKRIDEFASKFEKLKQQCKQYLEKHLEKVLIMNKQIKAKNDENTKKEIKDCKDKFDSILQKNKAENEMKFKKLTEIIGDLEEDRAQMTKKYKEIEAENIILKEKCSKISEYEKEAREIEEIYSQFKKLKESYSTSLKHIKAKENEIGQLKMVNKENEEKIIQLSKANSNQEISIQKLQTELEEKIHNYEEEIGKLNKTILQNESKEDQLIREIEELNIIKEKIINEIKEKEEEIIQLSRLLDEKSESLKDTLEKLEDLQESYEIKIKESNGENNLLRSENEEIIIENNAVRSENEEIAIENNKLKEEMKNFDLREINHKKQYDQVKKKIDELEDCITILQEENIEMSNRLKSQDILVDDLNKKYADSEKSCAELNAENIRTINIIKSMSNDIRNLENDRNIKDEEIIKSEKLCSELNAENIRMANNIQSMNNDIQNMKNEIKVKNEEIIKSDQELMIIKDENRILSKKLYESTKECQDSQNKTVYYLSNYSSVLNSMIESLSIRYESAIKITKEKLCKAEKSIYKLQNILPSLIDAKIIKLSKLNTQITDLTEAKIMNMINEKQHGLEYLINESEGFLLSRIETVNENIEAKLQSDEILSKKLENLVKEYNLIKEEVSSTPDVEWIYKDMENLKKSLFDIESKWKQATSEIELKEIELNSYKERIFSMENEISMLKQYKERSFLMENEIEILKNNLAEKESNNNSEMLLLELNSLQVKYDHAYKDLVDARSDLDKAKRDIEKLSIENSNQNRISVSEHQEQIENLQMQLNESLNNENVLKTQIEELRNDITGLTVLNNEIQKQRYSLESNSKDSEQKLEHEIKQLEDRIQLREEKIAELECYISSAEEALGGFFDENLEKSIKNLVSQRTQAIKKPPRPLPASSKFRSRSREHTTNIEHNEPIVICNTEDSKNSDRSWSSLPPPESELQEELKEQLNIGETQTKQIKLLKENIRDLENQLKRAERFKETEGNFNIEMLKDLMMKLIKIMPPLTNEAEGMITVILTMMSVPKNEMNQLQDERRNLKSSGGLFKFFNKK